jgi:4-diphosphocytidyl-2-C-methyl-D-erythritol kinase
MVVLNANAKLNLILRIIDKRPNGYHLLEMLNIPISIADEIYLDFSGDGLEQTFNPPLDCSLEKTTIYKAYQLISSWLGFKPGIKVVVNKHIPSGSGLGGGSSDAGFFIKYMTEHYGVNLNQQKITEIANYVGADVPFFIYNKPAIVKGIGEQVFPLNNFPKLLFLLIVPDFSISTSWAYSQVKLKLTKKEEHSNLKYSNIDLNTLKNIMHNDLEVIAERQFPAIIDIKNFLMTNGAEIAMMTGSGSAVFGIFENMEKAKEAELKTKLTFNAYKTFICYTIGA